MNRTVLPNPRCLPLALRLEDVDAKQRAWCRWRTEVCLPAMAGARSFTCDRCEAYEPTPTNERRDELIVLAAIGRWLFEEDGVRGNTCRRKR